MQIGTKVKALQMDSEGRTVLAPGEVVGVSHDGIRQNRVCVDFGRGIREWKLVEYVEPVHGCCGMIVCRCGE